MTQTPKLEYRQNNDILETQRARDGFKLICVGVIVFSAAYQVLLFAAAAMYGYRSVMALAIATAGVTYLSFLVQIVPEMPRRVTQVVVGASILLGASAGGLLAGFFIFG